MISTAQAAQYLETTLGITVPAFVLSAACERVEELEPAMTAAGYSEAKATIVQCMAVALVAARGAPRRLKNQAAPSGASRGFDYSKSDLTALRRALAAEDTASICSDLVGPDPAGQTLLMVV